MDDVGAYDVGYAIVMSNYGRVKAPSPNHCCAIVLWGNKCSRSGQRQLGWSVYGIS